MRKLLLIVSLVVFAQCSFGQGATKAGTKKLLLGKWASKDDSAFTILILKDQIIHFNKGEDDSDYYHYEVTPMPCDTTVPERSRTGFYLNETNREGLTTCNFIDVLTSDSMNLNYNWGSKLLRFKRRKQ